MERETDVQLSRGLLNLVTSLQPMMEGLFLVTIHDGRTGKVVFRYHASVAAEVAAFFDYMLSNYPDEFRLV